MHCNILVTPHDCLESCVDFKVITSTDFMNSNEAACIDLIGERCLLPDHSILIAKFKVGVQITEENSQSSVVKTRKRFRTFPENFSVL